MLAMMMKMMMTIQVMMMLVMLGMTMVVVVHLYRSTYLTTVRIQHVQAVAQRLGGAVDLNRNAYAASTYIDDDDHDEDKPMVMMGTDHADVMILMTGEGAAAAS